MQCPQCGHEAEGRTLFCANCGQKLDQSQTGAIGGPGNAQPAASDEQRRGCSQTVMVVAIAAVVILIIAGVGIAAVYYGLSDRNKIQVELAEEHFDKGNEHLTSGDLELAIAEYELVVQLDPEHSGAPGKLEEARQRLVAEPTPTAVLLRETKVALLDEIRLAHGRSDWQGVLDGADRLLALDPEYERGQVDQMLFEAFYQSGLILVEEDRLGEALRLFERALVLQPDNVQVSHAKNLATLYTQGTGYWGADWGEAATSLQTLYRLAPEYRDVRDRLFQALVNHGDQLGDDGDWCEAAEQYAQAVGIRAEAGVAAKRQSASSRCVQQPTAVALPGSTPGSTVPSGPLAASGTFVGSLRERTGLENSKMFVRGTVMNKSGHGIPGTRVRIGAWDWSALAVTDAGGQYSFDGLSTQVTYTLTLLDLTALPFDVEGVFGRISWVDFREAP